MFDIAKDRFLCVALTVKFDAVIVTELYRIRMLPSHESSGTVRTDEG